MIAFGLENIGAATDLFEFEFKLSPSNRILFKSVSSTLVSSSRSLIGGKFSLFSSPFASRISSDTLASCVTLVKLSELCGMLVSSKLFVLEAAVVDERLGIGIFTADDVGIWLRRATSWFFRLCCLLRTLSVS